MERIGTVESIGMKKFVESLSEYSDNYSKKIVNMREIKSQLIEAGCEKEYCIWCGEAYNKVNNYLKNPYIKQNITE